MIELSNERIEQILHEETLKKEETETILRSVYVRYMRLYEKYFADIDALDDETIAELKTYHEETRSLVKYYYMDIPQDICKDIRDFEKEYSDNLLGPKWHDCLFDYYEKFAEKSRGKDKNEVKAAFKKEILEAFYETMDYIFREGFGTGSKTIERAADMIRGLFFGKDK